MTVIATARFGLGVVVFDTALRRKTDLLAGLLYSLKPAALATAEVAADDRAECEKQAADFIAGGCFSRPGHVTVPIRR
jgi:hypothetical protein